MKILVVCQFYYPENFVVSKIAEELVRSGHEVDVLTGKPNYGYGYILPEYKNIKDEVVNGVNVHRVNLKPRKTSRFSIIRNYLSFWKNSKKWVRRCKKEYDVIYSMSISPVTICSAGNLYKKKHHVKHVIHCVDLWPESVLVTKAVRKKSLVYKILYKWSKSIYSKADRILVGSPSFADYFKDILKLPTDNISYVPQCSLVENKDVEPYDFGEGTHILYCGNLGLIQLIPLIVKSMNLMTDDNVKFHVIGMGPLTEYLKNEIKANRLENRLIYHGPIPAQRAATYFAGADALYVSLSHEGYVGKTIPNKLMMSMAFAKPIVAVLDGDGKKVLEESGGAILAEEDPRSVKDALIAISEMSEKEKIRLGQANRSYYDNNFSLVSVTKKIEEKLK